MNPYNAPLNDTDPQSYKPRYTREERIARRKRRRQARFMRRVGVLLCVLMIGTAAVLLLDREKPSVAPAPAEEQPVVSAPTVSIPEEEPEPVYAFLKTEDTVQIDGAFPSEFVILLDQESGEILAEKNADQMINPASMTKILTLLVAVENITDMDGTFTMTWDITDYCYNNECSVVGYEVGEIIPIQELFYGCILSSGADACLALAEIAAGSHENFVVLMNQKLDELGLSETAHFTNCVGLYDEDHYCTVGDMAMMLRAALEHEFCEEVLSTKVFSSAPTQEHPAGQDLSNWFIRRIEDEDTGSVDVLYGKTGYVSESGFCAASGGVTENGQTFLCVTGNSTSTWQSIYDHAELYRTYCTTEAE